MNRCQYALDLSEDRLLVSRLNLWVDPASGSIDQRSKTTERYRVEVIANRPDADACLASKGVGVPGQFKRVRTVALVPTRHRHNNAWIMEASRTTNDDSGMLADKLGRVGITREVDPIDLSDPRHAENESVPPAPPDPAGPLQLIVTWQDNFRSRFIHR